MSPVPDQDEFTVSVVIPCYNGMPYLPQALDSAVAQTYRPLEIIVVDDGSRDDSAGCVRGYAERYPGWIRLIQQPNAGEPAARNTGIRASRGSWVAMLDADDWWEPRKLERQVQAARDAGPACVLVHTGLISEYPDGRSVPGDLKAAGRRVGRCLRAMLEPGSIGHSSILVRRAALEKIGGYDASLPHAVDIDLYWRLLAVGEFAFVPEYLLHYRIHPWQISWRFKLDQVCYQCRVTRRFFQAHPELAQELGEEFIAQELERFVALKLESLYWNRRLKDFRRLLDWAMEQGMTGPMVQVWRKRARWPDWLILLKDRLTAWRSAGRVERSGD